MKKKTQTWQFKLRRWIGESEHGLRFGVARRNCRGEWLSVRCLPEHVVEYFALNEHNCVPIRHPSEAVADIRWQKSTPRTYTGVVEIDAPEKEKEKYDVTDPYGDLSWVVGSGDDFVCFSCAKVPDKRRWVLHGVVNSETGGFIQDFCYEVYGRKKDLVCGLNCYYEAALDWCGANTVDITSDNIPILIGIMQTNIG